MSNYPIGIAHIDQEGYSIVINGVNYQVLTSALISLIKSLDLHGFITIFVHPAARAA